MDHAPDLASPAAWWRWARQWRKTRLVDGVDRMLRVGQRGSGRWVF